MKLTNNIPVLELLDEVLVYYEVEDELREDIVLGFGNVVKEWCDKHSEDKDIPEYKDAE